MGAREVFPKISKLYLKQVFSDSMADSGLRSRWKRLRRRTTDALTRRNPERRTSESENLPQLIEDQVVITANVISTDTKATVVKPTDKGRRRSQKRAVSDDEPKNSKRRSIGGLESSVRIVRADVLSQLESPVSSQEDDTIQPLREFNNSNERRKMKANRRRSIATPTVTIIHEHKDLETPTKVDLQPNFLTPETDEEHSTVGLPIKESAKKSFPYQELYRGMINDLKDKTVPCPIYNAADAATEGRVTERHRAILIEWLLEVATEERYRRTTFHLAMSILDRYLYYRQNVPKSQLQTVGTSCLFLAAKMEEVTPPEIYRLVEYGDGAVVIDDLVKIEFDMLSHLKWRVEALTPLSFILLFCQAPEFWTEHTVLPRFNEKLLCFCATILDLTKLDPSSYKWSPAILGASIFIRVLEYVEVHREIRQEMNQGCTMELTDNKITELISSTLACHDSDLQNRCCDDYVTSFVSSFMKDLLIKIRCGEKTKLPPSTQQALKNCPIEASRLQTNFYGEQGVTRTLEDIKQQGARIRFARNAGDVDLKEVAECLLIPFEFLKCRKYRQNLDKSVPST